MTAAEVAHRLSREIVVVCSGDGRCVSVDARAEALLGVRAGEPLANATDRGSHAKLAALLEQAPRGPLRDWELCMLARGKPTTFSFDADCCDDGVVLVGAAIVQARTDAITAYQGALADLSEMHRETARQKAELARLNEELSESVQGLTSLHAELDETNDALRRSADVKARLVANVSHEFRTPIHSILGLSRLLLERVDGELSPEQSVQVEFIRSNAETLRNLIDDVVDLSKIEAGKTPLRPRPFAARDLFAALRGTVRALPRAEGVELVIAEASALPELTSDEGKIAQILRNLVSNALKFTMHGRITVNARVAENDQIAFEVADSGIGIDPEYHEAIFEDFAQIDSDAQRHAKGTGLGLSLSRRLADMLGGALSLQSEPGKGSTFTLTVPRVHIADADVQALVVVDQSRQRELAIARIGDALEKSGFGAGDAHVL